MGDSHIPHKDDYADWRKEQDNPRPRLKQRAHSELQSWMLSIEFHANGFNWSWQEVGKMEQLLFIEVSTILEHQVAESHIVDLIDKNNREARLH